MDSNPDSEIPDRENPKQEVEQEKPAQVSSPPTKQSRKKAKPKPGKSSDVLIPRPKENPLVTAMKERGSYKKQRDDGEHEIKCPWANEHVKDSDNETLYYDLTTMPL